MNKLCTVRDLPTLTEALASHADVHKGSSRVPAPRGAGTRDEPLTTSTWEATEAPLFLSLLFSTFHSLRSRRFEVVGARNNERASGRPAGLPLAPPSFLGLLRNYGHSLWESNAKNNFN